MQADLLGESVDPAGFRAACEVAGHVADSIGASLAKKYGGRRDLAAGDDPYPSGQYL